MKHPQPLSDFGHRYQEALDAILSATDAEAKQEAERAFAEVLAGHPKTRPAPARDWQRAASGDRDE